VQQPQDHHGERRRRFALIGNDAFSVINFRLPLLREIVALGHEVFSLAPDFSEDQRARLAAQGIAAVDYSLSRTGLNPARDLGDIVRLARILRGLKLDSVLAFSTKPVIYGTLAARWAGVPDRHALIAGLGYAFGESEVPSWRRRALRLAAQNLYRAALSQARTVFMQNPDDVRELVEAGIVPSAKVVRVNGTGVDLDVWPSLPAVTEPMTFLLAARLLREKGVGEFAEAARRIKAAHPHTRFILLGGLDSNPNSFSAAEVSNWVAEGLLDWSGHVPVAPWLAQTSVFVLPSYYREGVPKSILEAMASGRSIITTDAPGCRETVADGDNGWMVPPRNVDALVDAMQRFIVEPGLVAAMGARSRVMAVEKFDIRNVNATMIGAMGLGRDPASD
jgi:glycosyltransferase involved in cell wall biosynthesis